MAWIKRNLYFVIGSVIALALMGLAGRRFYPATVHVPLVSFALALLVATFSLLSIGFVIASLVPTARFAQPVGGLLLYPMIGISGLFLPVQKLPFVLQVIAQVLPLTYAVSAIRGRRTSVTSPRWPSSSRPAPRFRGACFGGNESRSMGPWVHGSTGGGRRCG